MLTTKVNQAHNITLPWYIQESFFSEEELNNITNYLDKQKLVPGTVGNGLGATNLKFRACEVSLIGATDDNKWLFDKLFKLVETVNTNNFRFDLYGFNFVQYTVYNQEGDHQSLHADLFYAQDSLTRKLSFSLILSDEDSYDGGDFEIHDPAVTKIPQKRGSVIVFPSFIYHKVTPITRGVRKSLVFWAVGPKFK